MTPNYNFMSLYEIAFVISGIRRILFDIHGHQKKKYIYMLFLLKTTGN